MKHSLFLLGSIILAVLTNITYAMDNDEQTPLITARNDSDHDKTKCTEACLCDYFLGIMGGTIAGGFLSFGTLTLISLLSPHIPFSLPIIVGSQVGSALLGGAIGSQVVRWSKSSDKPERGAE